MKTRRPVPPQASPSRAHFKVQPVFYSEGVDAFIENVTNT